METKQVLSGHKSPILEFRARWSLDWALSDARLYNDPDKFQVFPATRSGLAYALDWVESERISCRGCWGSATCDLFAVMGEGEICVEINDTESYDRPDGTCISEARAYKLLTCDGEIDAAKIHALHTNIWDGHNHISFVPSRSLALLADEDRYERNGHALVAWNSEGGVEDIRIDDGWTTADEYWGTLGNIYWTYGDLNAHERGTALTTAGIPCDTVWLTGDDVVILVPEDDLARAIEVMLAPENS